MVAATTYEYITRRKDTGEPIIAGTHTSVRTIVEKWRVGTPPEEIPLGLPHLTVSQVFAALAYFSDHKDEINGYIAKNRVPKELVGKTFSGKELVEMKRQGRL